MNVQFLRQKEGPFLLALLVAAGAWLIDHAVDRLLARPIVEYQITETADSSGTTVICRVENLCADRCFKNLKFTLAGPSKGGMYFTNAQVLLSDIGGTPNAPEFSPRQLAILFPEFHPRWYFEFRCQKLGNFKCRLLVATQSEDVPTEAVELTKAGLATWLIRFEMHILSVLLLLALVTIVAYLRWLNTRAGGGAPAKT